MNPQTLKERVEQLSTDIGITHDFVHGTETQTVDLGGKATPSLRKLVHDIDERESRAAQQVIDSAKGQIEAQTRESVAEVTRVGDAQVKRVTVEGDRQTARAKAEADRAQWEADRAGNLVLLGSSAHNLEATWVQGTDVAAGGELALPSGLAYFAGRNMVRLSYDGVALYPGAQFEEVGTADAVSSSLRMLTPLMAVPFPICWIRATILSGHSGDSLERAGAPPSPSAGSADEAARTVEAGSVRLAREAEAHGATLAGEVERGRAEADRARAEADRAAAGAGKAGEEADRAWEAVSAALREVDLTGVHAHSMQVLERVSHVEMRLTKVELALLGLQGGDRGGSGDGGGSGGAGVWDETGAYLGPVAVGTSLIDLKGAGVLLLTDEAGTADSGSGAGESATSN